MKHFLYITATLFFVTINLHGTFAPNFQLLLHKAQDKQLRFDVQGAQDAYQEILSLCNEHEYPQTEIRALVESGLAMTYVNQKNLVQASIHLATARRLLNVPTDPTAYTEADYVSAASSYYAVDALNSFFKAQNAIQANESIDIINIFGFHAENAFKKAHAIAFYYDKPIEQAVALHGMSSLLEFLYIHGKAATHKTECFDTWRNFLNTALMLIKSVHSADHPFIAYTYHRLGRRASFFGNKEETETYYQKALEIYKKNDMTNTLPVVQQLMDDFKSLTHESVS